MLVNFSASGPLKRAIAEAGGLQLDLPAGANVRDALVAASESLGTAGALMRDDAGHLRTSLVVFVNDELIRRNGIDNEVHEGDELTVLMPVAGGS